MSRSGRPRVAIIDSGVNADHPHVGGVTGGVSFHADGAEHADFVDHLGHGTAVTAVIREKAPQARIYAIKIFSEGLHADIEALLGALDWAFEREISLVNLSLGTRVEAHRAALQDRVERGCRLGSLVVAAVGDDDVAPYLPGDLPAVLPVTVDWRIARDRVQLGDEGRRPIVRASGFPRPIPGVDPSRNLKGTSFAVANVVGLIASAMDGDGPLDVATGLGLLRGFAQP